MGYTHYWNQPRSFAPNEWDQIVRAVERIVEIGQQRAVVYNGMSLTVHVKGPYGLGVPVFDANSIALNGDGPKFDHEPFVLRRVPDQPTGFDCCKTARKPYDLVVTAALAYMAACWGYDVSSDGDFEDWESGAQLACDVLGLPVPNPIIVNEFIKGVK